MPGAHVTTLMDADAPATMENLDRSLFRLMGCKILAYFGQEKARRSEGMGRVKLRGIRTPLWG